MISLLSRRIRRLLLDGKGEGHFQYPSEGRLEYFNYVYNLNYEKNMLKILDRKVLKE